MIALQQSCFDKPTKGILNFKRHTNRLGILLKMQISELRSKTLILDLSTLF